jgi:predicted DNA binding CopG/RHH family protein
MKQTLPTLTTDEEAEAFLENSDLSQYDLSGMKSNTFEFSLKAKQVNMRMSEQLLEAVKARAAQQGMSYQRFIRQALETALQAKP